MDLGIRTLLLGWICIVYANPDQQGEINPFDLRAFDTVFHHDNIL